MSTAGDDEYAAADADDHVASGQILHVVQDALRGMKPELRDVFVWRTTTPLSFAEIARRQGTGVNTALGRMHQATRHLHAALRGAGLLPEEGTP